MAGEIKFSTKKFLMYSSKIVRFVAGINIFLTVDTPIIFLIKARAYRSRRSLAGSGLAY